jgi:hypothetical protein
MGGWALLAGLAVAGVYLWNNSELSSNAPVSPSPVQGAKTMNVAYASPILLASVNGITFSASWSASAGSPVAGWIFAFAIDPNFTQSYVEVDLPANQTSVSNNQANSTYYFRIRFVDQNGVLSPWSNSVGPLTSGPAPAGAAASGAAPVVTAPVSATSTASNAPVAAPVVMAPASATSTASNAPVAAPAIPQVYEQSGPTTIAESGASTSEQAMQAQAVTSLVQTYSANLEVLIGQPVQFLQMVQQLFGGNPGLLDQVSDSVKAYFNQLVNNGPGGSISAYDLSNYYEAIAQHGAVQGPQVFAYWKANGMLSEPSLSGVDQYLVPATVLP